MPNHSIAFDSTPSSIAILLDVFFNVQYNEHVKVWKWSMYVAGKFKYVNGGIVYG